MKRILTSLHDTNTVGIEHNGGLVTRQGLYVGSGKGGSVYGQMPMPSPRHVVFFDDFNRAFDPTVATDPYVYTEGTDSATSAAAILAGGIGGVLRLTTGDAGSGLAADTCQLTTRVLGWQASNGGLTYEIRVKLSAITTCWAFFGFTDTVAASLEAPVISASSANTITTNASDAVGWMFDTRMSTDNWWMVGVAADTDATAQNSGYAPVADTYEVLRISISAAGAATFYRNGVPVGKIMSGAVTAATDLTPIIAVSKTSVAASMTCDVDYLMCAMDRA